jgi:4-diphosphocytidyl-2-C-methyl-D-erythritol kinase
MAQLVMQELNAPGRVSIAIDKRLPVQGGLGAASSNAVATLLGLEQAFRQKLPDLTRLGLAAEVGSDLPQFLVGGASLGVGRGEEVYPLADFPAVPVVLVMPEVGVSTARAFADWDALLQSGAESSTARQSNVSAATQARWTQAALTRAGASDRMFLTGGALAAWLFKFSSGYPNTGASAKGGSRAGNLLSDLVRTGIENDFERVVFPQYPELRDIKGALERAGAKYASLSGSGSTLYGLFRSRADADKAARRLQKQGVRAVATKTLTRSQYWKKSLVVGR